MSQAKPFDTATFGLTLVLCFGTTAMANPLYLGKEEYNTENRSVMAAIIEHCVSLQAEAEPAETGGTQRDSEGEERRQEADPGQAEVFAGSLGISTDGLASGDGKGEAPDLSDVSTEDCAAAGINY